ncbi:MAG: hypothetical protein ACOCPR_07350 [Guyparkeria sp.]
MPTTGFVLAFVSLSLQDMERVADGIKWLSIMMRPPAGRHARGLPREY